MAYTECQKVQFGTHVLSKEAKYLWDNVCQRLEVVGTKITWVVFRAYFLEKYFPEDVCSKKLIESLELKRGNMVGIEYVAKFEELVNFFPYYNGVATEGLKCIKFENGIRHEIKQGIDY